MKKFITLLAALLLLLSLMAGCKAANPKSTVDADIPIRDGCRMKIHAGPGQVKISGMPIPLPDPEIKFVLDMDLYMPGKIPVPRCIDVMSTLHAQAYPIFRFAITQKLHEAMEPQPI